VRIDANFINELAAEVTRKIRDEISKVRIVDYGEVKATAQLSNGGWTAEVLLPGAATNTAPLNCLIHYAPAIGDWVMIIYPPGGDPVILGEAPAIENTVQSPDAIYSKLGHVHEDLFVPDTRGDATTPNTYSKELQLNFKSTTSIGLSGAGTYALVVGLAPWGDDSGGGNFELAFSNGKTFIRYGTRGAGWGGWSQIPDTQAGATFAGKLLWGSSALRVETKSDFGAASESGFYESSAPTNGPLTNVWQHLLAVRHSNAGNNYQMQFAASFFNSDDIFFRVTSNSPTAPWYRMIHTNNHKNLAGVQDPWTAPSFLNGWLNYGNGYNPAGYFKDSMGMVHLRGLVKSGTMNAAIFNLPAGYRPAYRNLFVNQSNGAIGRPDVTTVGDVIPAAGSNAWFSLDGISFRAEQ
jgi:hypothetical protein